MSGADTPTSAVVFVHGLFSSGRTWAAMRARLAEDDEINTQITDFAFDYPSPKFSLHPLRVIPDYDAVALLLRTYLELRVAGYERIVLVSHSQGGLIVQRFLARMLQENQGLQLSRIRAVVMFACPNSGSELGIMVRRIAKFWVHPQERQLRPLDDEVTRIRKTVLRGIQDATRLDATQCPIPIYAYAGLTDGVVSYASACDVFARTGALPGDHFSIIAADSSDALAFLALKERLREALGTPELRVPAEPLPNSVPAERVSPDARIHHNLAAPTTDFVNRTSELARTHAGLTSRNQVVSIWGLGGMGKSALACRIGWELVKAEGDTRFDVIVWHDQKAGPHSLDALIDAISDVLHFPYLRALPMPDKMDHAIGHLNSARCLIIIDNLDDVDDPEIRGFIARIDPTHSKVLVTSRQRFSGDAWSVDIGGLDDRASSELAGSEARRLDIPQLEPSGSGGERSGVRNYLVATGGSPLAIRLTAAQMRYGGDDLAAVTARLRSAADRDLFEAIFDRTWNELLAHDRDARTMVMSVALHPTSAGREAIGAVVALPEDELRGQLQALGATSLLEFSRAEHPDGSRLRVHPLTRAYALSKLDPHTRAHLEDRLIDYYRDFCTAHADIYTQPQRIRLLERERENILAFADTAYRRAVESERKNECRNAIDFAETLAGFLWVRGYWSDLIRLCTQAAETARIAHDRVGRARMFALLGRVQVWRGGYADTLDCLQQSEAALPPDAAAADRRETIRLRAQFDSRFGEYSTARRLFGEVLEQAPETADAEGRAATLVELGMCALRESEFPIAIETFQTAQRQYERMGSLEGAANSLVHLADAWFESGRPAHARPMYERGLLLASQIDHSLSLGRCHLGLAKIAVVSQDYERARRRARTAREYFVRLGMTDMVAEADVIVGNTPDPEHPADSHSATIARLLNDCRAVLFDFDDTVAATIRTRWPALRSTAATFGVLLEDETIRAAWGKPIDQLIATIVPTIDPIEFDVRYRQAMAAQRPVPTVGAAALLEALRQRGIRLIIVSSGKYEYVLQDLRQMGLEHYFERGDIYGFAETGAHKPDRAVLRRPIEALSRAGIVPEKIRYVGDSRRDYAAAKGNEVEFLAVLTGTENRQDFLDAGLPDSQIAGNLSLLRLWL
ncbi:alpha/beta fold hydrolase [Nocardia sp. NPDC050712]|uniref:alpha/beta fold hydrolase n=1 Tax=Nocardia sp. NPDC050712 TaxID=3155518 RepID=UPI0033CCABB9